MLYARKSKINSKVNPVRTMPEPVRNRSEPCPNPARTRPNPARSRPNPSEPCPKSPGPVQTLPEPGPNLSGNTTRVVEFARILWVWHFQNIFSIGCAGASRAPPTRRPTPKRTPAPPPRRRPKPKKQNFLFRPFSNWPVHPNSPHSQLRPSPAGGGEVQSALLAGKVWATIR